MLRVLHVLTSMNMGGMESIIMNMYRGIDRKKVQFDFLLFDTEEKQFYEEEIEKMGGKIYKVISRRKNLFLHKKQMKKFFQTHSYSIVHIHQGISYFLPLKLAKKYHIKKRIIHNHGVDLKYKKGIWNFFRKFFILPYINFLATDRFACSEQVLSSLFTKRVIQTHSYQILNNSIDALKYQYDVTIRKEERKKLYLKDEFVIGHVGSFTYPKNHEFLLKIFKELQEKNFSSKLILVGIGDEMGKCKQICKELKIEDQVIFYGRSNHIDRLVQVFDLFCLPSHFEGLPLVCIEAQASGLPLVVSKEAVSKEADITGNIQFISLKESPAFWADKIISTSKGFKRVNTTETIIAHGYDSKTEAKKLEEFYLKREL